MFNAEHFSDGCFHMKFPFLFRITPRPTTARALLEMFPSPLQASDFFGLDRDTYPQSKNRHCPSLTQIVKPALS